MDLNLLVSRDNESDELEEYIIDSEDDDIFTHKKKKKKKNPIGKKKNKPEIVTAVPLTFRKEKKYRPKINIQKILSPEVFILYEAFLYYFVIFFVFNFQFGDFEDSFMKLMIRNFQIT